jgi:hypothetical protein
LFLISKIGRFKIKENSKWTGAHMSVALDTFHRVHPITAPRIPATRPVTAGRRPQVLIWPHSRRRSSPPPHPRAWAARRRPSRFHLLTRTLTQCRPSSPTSSKQPMSSALSPSSCAGSPHGELPVNVPPRAAAPPVSSSASCSPLIAASGPPPSTPPPRGAPHGPTVHLRPDLHHR